MHMYCTGSSVKEEAPVCQVHGVDDLFHVGLVDGSVGIIPGQEQVGFGPWKAQYSQPNVNKMELLRVEFGDVLGAFDNFHGPTSIIYSGRKGFSPLMSVYSWIPCGIVVGKLFPIESTR